MIDRLVIFGGTGDLAGRYLLPALAALIAGGHLFDRFEFVGTSREDWDDERYRDWAADWLKRQASDVDPGARTTLLRSSRYHQLDLGDPANVAECIAGDGPVAVYLALPPAVFPPAVKALKEAGLPPESQVVLEKPFGEDLDSAIALNVWEESLALEGCAGYYDRARDIPAYVDEDGVTPDRGTETFAEVTLELDSWRWADTRFRLRTAKADA